MKHYLKIENNSIVEAPFKTVIDGDTVYGYNAESNDKNLKKAGYKAYNKPAYEYEIKDGAIVERQPVIYQQSIWTKLQIRRAFRALGIEDQLDLLLQAYPDLKKDWTDAVEIDLDDPALSGLDSALIKQIKDYLNENPQ